MTVTTNSHDDDDDEDISSPTERCAFVLHVTVAIFAVVYTAWVLLAMFGGATSGGSNMPLPPPSWLTHTLPTVAVGLFFAAPILYAVQNMTIVAPAHSIASLQDSVTTKQRRQNVVSEQQTTTERRPAQNNDSNNNAARQGLPEIVDLDVGEINDLCWKAMQTSSW
jgi:hypothetical protein